MRDKIADIIYTSDCDNDLSRTVEKIMDLIGPELEKARLWDRLEKIALKSCELCPEFTDHSFSCHHNSCPYEYVIDALAKKEVGDAK